MLIGTAIIVKGQKVGMKISISFSVHAMTSNGIIFNSSYS